MSVICQWKKIAKHVAACLYVIKFLKSEKFHYDLQFLDKCNLPTQLLVWIMKYSLRKHFSSMSRLSCIVTHAYMPGTCTYILCVERGSCQSRMQRKYKTIERGLATPRDEVSHRIRVNFSIYVCKYVSNRVLCVTICMYVFIYTRKCHFASV